VLDANISSNRPCRCRVLTSWMLIGRSVTKNSP